MGEGRELHSVLKGQLRGAGEHTVRRVGTACRYSEATQAGSEVKGWTAGPRLSLPEQEAGGASALLIVTHSKHSDHCHSHRL